MSTTSAPSVHPQNLPVALTLPIELWIHILFEFDDFELKRITRICKRLAGFVRHSQGAEFDRPLYRAAPRTPAVGESQRVFLHPMIDKTGGIFDRLEEATMYNHISDKVHYPKDYPTVLGEFATRPTSTQIDVEIPNVPVQRLAPLRNSTGVTARDFLEHLGTFWSTTASECLAVRHTETYGKQTADVTYMNYLYHRYVWNSWRQVIDHGENCTLLLANNLNS